MYLPKCSLSAYYLGIHFSLLSCLSTKTVIGNYQVKCTELIYVFTLDFMFYFSC